MTSIRPAPSRPWLTVLALAVLLVVALLCGYQVLSGLLGGEIFTGAAGQALWIRWPNVPDLFVRAILFYGLGFLICTGCAWVIGAGIVDQRLSQDQEPRMR